MNELGIKIHCFEVSTHIVGLFFVAAVIGFGCVDMLCFILSAA